MSKCRRKPCSIEKISVCMMWRISLSSHPGFGRSHLYLKTLLAAKKRYYKRLSDRPFGKKPMQVVGIRYLGAVNGHNEVSFAYPSLAGRAARHYREDLYGELS